MEAWIIGVIVAVVNTIITTIAGLLIKKQWDKRQKESEELERLREEARLHGEAQRCELVKQAVHEEVLQLDRDLTTKSLARHDEMRGAVQAVKGEIDNINEDLCLMKKAMQKDIRRSLRQDAKIYIQREWATGQEKTEYDELYWCYHNLGKNGVVDSDHAKVMDLPELPPKGEN